MKLGFLLRMAGQVDSNDKLSPDGRESVEVDARAASVLSVHRDY